MSLSGNPIESIRENSVSVLSGELNQCARRGFSSMIVQGGKRNKKPKRRIAGAKSEKKKKGAR